MASMTVSALVTSPPTIVAPARSHSATMPRVTSSTHWTGSSPGMARPNRSARRLRAHRGDVSKILGGGLDADIRGRRPVAAEMPALDQQIGARHDPPVRSWQDRGIVADADHGRVVRRQQRPDRRYQPELAEIGNGNDSLLARPLAADHGAPLR